MFPTDNKTKATKATKVILNINKAPDRVAKSSKKTEAHGKDCKFYGNPAKKGARGRIIKFGDVLLYECTCTARMSDRSHNISCHETRKHSENSTYANGQQFACKDACDFLVEMKHIQAGNLDCETVYKNFSTLLSHVRNKHALRGHTSTLRDHMKAVAAEKGKEDKEAMMNVSK